MSIRVNWFYVSYKDLQETYELVESFINNPTYPLHRALSAVPANKILKQCRSVGLKTSEITEAAISVGREDRKLNRDLRFLAYVFNVPAKAVGNLLHMTQHNNRRENLISYLIMHSAMRRLVEVPTYETTWESGLFDKEQVHIKLCELASLRALCRIDQFLCLMEVMTSELGATIRLNDADHKFFKNLFPMPKWGKISPSIRAWVASALEIRRSLVRIIQRSAIKTAVLSAADRKFTSRGADMVDVLTVAPVCTYEDQDLFDTEEPSFRAVQRSDASGWGLSIQGIMALCFLSDLGRTIAAGAIDLDACEAIAWVPSLVNWNPHSHTLPWIINKTLIPHFDGLATTLRNRPYGPRAPGVALPRQFMVTTTRWIDGECYTRQMSSYEENTEAWLIAKRAARW